MNCRFSARSGHCEAAEFSVDVSTRQGLRSHCANAHSVRGFREAILLIAKKTWIASSQDAPRNDDPKTNRIAGLHPSPAKRGEGGHIESGANDGPGGGGSAGEEFAQGNALFTPTRRFAPPQSELRSSRPHKWEGQERASCAKR